MPNGSGMHDCANCSHLTPSSVCSLRKVPIENSHHTRCHDFAYVGRRRLPWILRLISWLVIFILTCGKNVRKRTSGPLYAIVDAVEDGSGGYCWQIPYFDGHRADVFRLLGGGIVIRFTDGDNKVHEFSTVADYLRFYKESGREL